MTETRRALVGRSRRLNIATLLYNSLEGIVGLTAGLMAGSVALVGFAVDSGIELSASAIALWRLDADADVRRRASVERISHRAIGVLFLALAAYVTYDAIDALEELKKKGS